MTNASPATATASDKAKPGIEALATWADLRVRTVGNRHDPRQIVILLHGWGAPGDDLVPFGDMLAAPDRLFVFPEAPLVSPGGGRAWWHLDLEQLQAARERGQERDLRQAIPDGLAAARTHVTELVAVVATKAPLAAIVIGGFSQGAMLATDVALASPTAFSGLVALSGTLLSEGVWMSRLAATKAGFPVLLSHGRRDPILPFHLSEALYAALQGAGRVVTWVPFEGGHEIPQIVLVKLARFLAERSTPGASAR